MGEKIPLIITTKIDMKYLGINLNRNLQDGYEESYTIYIGAQKIMLINRKTVHGFWKLKIQYCKNVNSCQNRL